MTYQKLINNMPDPSYNSANIGIKILLIWGTMTGKRT